MRVRRAGERVSADGSRSAHRSRLAGDPPPAAFDAGCIVRDFVGDGPGRLVRGFFLVFLLFFGAAHAIEIEVRSPALRASEEGLLLSADFAFDFGPRLTEILASGIPLYFLAEFELTRSRWWWIDERVTASRIQYRLSYHALTRTYRVSSGPLQRNFESLEEALGVMKRLRNWLVLERQALQADNLYHAALRLRLDSNQLPRPLQLGAITSRDLVLESAWARFDYRPPFIPAPVESREPREDAAR